MAQLETYGFIVEITDYTSKMLTGAEEPTAWMVTDLQGNQFEIGLSCDSSTHEGNFGYCYVRMTLNKN